MPSLQRAGLEADCKEVAFAATRRLKKINVLEVSNGKDVQCPYVIQLFEIVLPFAWDFHARDN